MIMSLWPVEDEACREWMKALYQASMKEGKDTAEALKQANVEVLERRRGRGLSTHPHYWAAFVAVGDWR